MKIGTFQPETNLLLAPIAGYTDVAFRMIVRSAGGVGLACTDLLSPQGLVYGSSGAAKLAATCQEDRPLCVQLYGSDPQWMAEGARYARDHGAAVIDLNLGCPARKVVKKNGGVALMRDPERATRIVRAAVEAVDTPITVKMRLGFDDASRNAADLARRFEDAGAQAVTVHGRTGAQLFKGRADLDGIAEVVAAVRSIPVIGNGDVKSPQDAETMIQHTGCAGVMIGRRALADPWIFRDTHAWLTNHQLPPPPTVEQRLALITRHFDMLRQNRGDRIAVIAFRQRFSWYARALPASKALKIRIGRTNTPAEFHQAIEAYRAEHAAQPPA